MITRKPLVLLAAALTLAAAAAFLSPAQAQQNAAPAGGTWTVILEKASVPKVMIPREGNPNIASMAVSPDGSMIVAGIMRQGFCGSTDDGKTWVKLGAEDKEQIISLCTDILFDPKDSKIFYVAGAYEHSLFRTTDSGKTFQPISALWHMDNIAVDFSDPDRKTMLSGMHESSRRLYRTIDGGKSWWNIGKPRPDYAGFPEKLGINTPLILDSKTYIIGCWAAWLTRDGVKDGIVITEDAGLTWKKVSDRAPNSRPLVASSGSIFWHTDKGMIKSADRGQTWTDVPTVTATPIELPDKKILSAKAKQLYTSSDDGATWTPLADPAPGNISEIAYSPKSKSYFIKSGPKLYRLSTGG